MTQVNKKINRYQQYDSNSDRGYGRLTPKFHKPRSFLQYTEPPEHDLEAQSQIDDETYAAVVSRLLDYNPVDSLAKNKTDPFYFVGSATKLGEVAKGMVPFPNMYKSKQAVTGGTNPKYPTGPTAGFQSRSRPTGTKRGFSKAPYPEPQQITAQISDNENYNDIITTDLDARHVELIKNIVKLIHLKQDQ